MFLCNTIIFCFTMLIMCSAKTYKIQPSIKMHGWKERKVNVVWIYISFNLASNIFDIFKICQIKWLFLSWLGMFQMKQDVVRNIWKFMLEERCLSLTPEHHFRKLLFLFVLFICNLTSHNLLWRVKAEACRWLDKKFRPWCPKMCLHKCIYAPPEC